MKLREKMKRVELNQHIETDIAFDAETMRSRIQTGIRAKLHAVRGDSEIGFSGQARIVARAQVNGEAIQLRKVCRRIERVMHATNRQREIRRSFPF